MAGTQPVDQRCLCLVICIRIKFRLKMFHDENECEDVGLNRISDLKFCPFLAKCQDPEHSLNM